MTEITVVDSSPKQPSVVNGNSFVTSVVSSYGDLTKKPLSLFLLILALLSLIAESNNSSGPFEIIQKTLEDYIASHSKDTPLISTLATFLLGLVKFVVAHKILVFQLMLISVIPITYPTESNFLVVFVLTIYICVSTHSIYVKIFIVQCVFVYYGLRNNYDRLFVMVLVIIIAFGTENISIFLGSK